ncbi:MAG: lysine exporter LysO family protein [Oscillibacter sp.]|nr:lysine exporter LysO family protein [Oscillibacter sp.]
MLIILCLMAGGILLGRLTRAGRPEFIRKGIFGAILVLLFLLGVSVGHNRQIMDNLGTIGVDALLITLGAVGGSVVCAWGIYKFYFSKPGR